MVKYGLLVIVKKKRSIHLFIYFIYYLYPLIFENNQLIQWDPPTFDEVDDSKVDLVFQPFKDNLELQVSENEKHRSASFQSFSSELPSQIFNPQVISSLLKHDVSCLKNVIVRWNGKYEHSAYAALNATEMAKTNLISEL